MITQFSAPMLMVCADESISDCVNRMKEHQVGALLIMSDDGKGKLAGIFTERDLLQHFDLVNTGGFWQQPIRTVMTRSPITLPVSRFREGAKVMLENSFRHLPLVAPDENGDFTVLVGMISMRDLLRHYVEGKNLDDITVEATAQGLTPIVGVFTSDDHALKILQSEIAKTLKIQFDEYTVDSLLAQTATQSLQELSALILDLDMPSTAQWLNFVRSGSSRTRQLPPMLLLFDPRKHSKETFAALAKLENASKITAFSKPVRMLELLVRLKQLISEKPR